MFDRIYFNHNLNKWDGLAIGCLDDKDVTSRRFAEGGEVIYLLIVNS